MSEADMLQPAIDTVAALMRRHPITLAPDTDVAAATDLLTCTATSSPPVIEAGRLVGVVSHGDVIQALARANEPAAP